MPSTPDRRPGLQYEDDAIVFEDRGSDIASGDRGIYNKGGDMWARDSVGAFNIRQAGADDNRYLIFKIDGGLVYTTAGDVTEKSEDP